MNNVFAMVTLKNSSFYTDYALESFFRYTEIDNSDEFLLINNDGDKLDKFSIYKKINVLNNNVPFSFAKNVNQGIAVAKKDKKNLVFLNNDIIFTKKWFVPFKQDSNCISIPVSNQLFLYHTECKNLILKPTMNFKNFNKNYDLLNKIVAKHMERFKSQLQFQTLLMPFFCFKLPYKILSEIGDFDETFGIGGGEDIDYRIRCAIKEYQVNFFTNSYLLHFHGKSTWDGSETKEQTKARNKFYTEAFIKKWGEKITKIFLKNDFSNTSVDEKLHGLFKPDKFGDLIRKTLK